MPRLLLILCRVTELPDGCPDALAQPHIKLNCSSVVFVRVHGLPPGSPRFCPPPSGSVLCS